MLGLGTAVESLTRVAAPTLGGLLLQDLGTSAPGIFGAALLALLLPYAWRQLSQLSVSHARDRATSRRPERGFVVAFSILQTPGARVLGTRVREHATARTAWRRLVPRHSLRVEPHDRAARRRIEVTGFAA